MKRSIEAFNRLYSAVNSTLCILSGVIVACLALLITASVIGRRLFNAPITGTFEITEALLVFVVMMPMAYTQFRGGHLRVTLLTRRFPLALARGLYCLGLCLGALFFAWAAWATAGFALQSWRMGEMAWGSALQFPLYPSKGVIAIGCGLLALQFALDAIRVGIFNDIKDTDELAALPEAAGGSNE